MVYLLRIALIRRARLVELLRVVLLQGTVRTLLSERSVAIIPSNLLFLRRYLLREVLIWPEILEVHLFQAMTTTLRHTKCLT